MREVVVTLSETMPGPPDVVWGLITDWEHQDDWMLEASDFVVTSDHREGMGVEAEATIRIAGITTRDRIRVVEWAPPNRLAIEHLGWVQGTGEITLRALASDVTRLEWREELRAPHALGTVGALGLRALSPLMTRIFRRDLRVLRGLARARMGAEGG